MSNVPVDSDITGKPVAAIPIRIVTTDSAADETGKQVASMPIRIVTGKADTDSTGKPIDVQPVVQVAGTTTTDELGRPISVRPAKVSAADGAVPVRDIGTPTATLTFVTEPASRPYQRSTKTGGGYGKGQGAIPINVSVSTATPLWARTRSAGDGTTIVQAPFQVSSNFAGGAVTVSGIDVPDVVANPAHGAIYLDVAASSSGPWTQGTQAFMIGRGMAGTGQSQFVRMIKRMADDTSTTINATIGDANVSPYAWIFASINDSVVYPSPIDSTNLITWQRPVTSSTYDGLGMAEMLNRAVATFGVACFFIGYAHGGASITTLSTGSGWTRLSNVITTAGGAFEAFLFYQGGSDAPNSIPWQAYSAALSKLVSQCMAINSFSGSVTKYTMSYANRNDTNQTPYQACQLRLANEALHGSDGYTHLMPNDIQLISDGDHEKQLGAQRLGQHFARAMQVEAGVTLNDRGPQLIAATRVDGTHTDLTFSDVGQGDLVLEGSPQNILFCFPKGYRDKSGTTQNRYAISAVSKTNKTTLRVTHDDPGAGSELDFFVYWINGVTNDGTLNNIRDDITSDGFSFGRHVTPNLVAVTAAALTPGGTITAPTGGFVRSSPLTLPGVGTPTYASDGVGFGQQMTGGAAISAGSTCPGFMGYTIEGWFTYGGAPASGNYDIFGGIGSTDFVGINTAGKLTNGAAVSASALTIGTRYHFAIQTGSTGTQIYLNGAQVAFSATARSASINSTKWAIRQSVTGSSLMGAGTVDEIAIFYGQRRPTTSGASFTPPTAAYTGAESNIVALYHLDGNLNEELWQ